MCDTEQTTFDFHSSILNVVIIVINLTVVVMMGIFAGIKVLKLFSVVHLIVLGIMALKRHSLT